MNFKKNNLQKRIYLDYAATTPVASEVKEAMMPYFSQKFGNPSSVHAFGREAQAALDKSRDQVAGFLGAKSNEIYFPSSATEANNWLIYNFAFLREKPRIVMSAGEHKSILEPAKRLKENGLVELDLAPLGGECVVAPEEIEKRVKDNTILVSLMAANSEVGVIQPLKEIAEIIRQKRKEGREIYFHTDAVQAAQFLPLEVNELGVDYLTLSSHKIYGPKGAAALYVREGAPIEPLLFGGSQERKKRAGTENVPAIAGFGEAAELVLQNRETSAKRLAGFRDELRAVLLKNIPGVKINGSWEKRLPNNINLSFPGVNGEMLTVALDRAGVAVSTGSACAAKARRPSHVLEAMGLSDEEIKGSIRISLGRMTTEEEISRAASILMETVKSL